MNLNQILEKQDKLGRICVFVEIGYCTPEDIADYGTGLKCFGGDRDTCFKFQINILNYGGSEEI